MKHFKKEVAYLSIDQSFLNLLKLGFYYLDQPYSNKKTFYSFQFSKTYEFDLLKSEYLAQKLYSLDETFNIVIHLCYILYVLHEIRSHL